MKVLFGGVLILLIAFIPVDHAVAQSCVSPTANLVSWWPSDGSAADIIDGNDGTMHGGTTFADGIAGQAYDLDGVDGFVDFGSSAGNFGNNDFTVDLWFNFRDLTGEQVIIEKYIEKFDSTRSGWGITKLPDSMLRLYGPLSTVTAGIIPDFAVPNEPGTWHHLAITRNGNSFTVFWDGSPAKSGGVGTSLNLDTIASLKIGHRGNPSDTPGSRDSSGFYMNGLIDEVRIFNRALSSEEVKEIFDAGGSGQCMFNYLSVNANDLNGRQVTGMWTTVRAMDGTLLKSGFTPFTFTGIAGTQYKVTVANYDGKIFDRWQDDKSTSKSRLITLTANTTLTAIYDTGDASRGFTSLTYTGTPEQPDLTINALASGSNKTLHMWTIVDPEVTNSSATTYKVYATNGYQNLVFDHWEDGSTSRVRTITIGVPTTITAYYKTGTSTVSFSAHYHDIDGPGTPVCDDVISGNCGPFFGNAEKSGAGGVTGTWSQHLPRGALCSSGGPISDMTTNGTTFTITGTYTGTCDIFEPGNAVTVSGKCGANSEISFKIGGVENKFIGDSTCTA